MYMGSLDWCGVVSFHPLHQLPSELLEQSPSITNHHPNKSLSILGIVFYVGVLPLSSYHNFFSDLQGHVGNGGNDDIFVLLSGLICLHFWHWKGLELKELCTYFLFLHLLVSPSCFSLILMIGKVAYFQGFLLLFFAIYLV